MSDVNPSKDELIRDYKLLLQEYLSIRPAGYRRKIADAIGSNRSFVSQITSPQYRVPIPGANLQKIMDVCHFSPLERMMFTAAFVRAHPNQAEMVERQNADDDARIDIDLSRIADPKIRALISQTVRHQVEAMMALYLGSADRVSCS